MWGNISIESLPRHQELLSTLLQQRRANFFCTLDLVIDWFVNFVFWCSSAESCLASPCMSGSRKLNNLSISTNLTSASKDDIISSTSQHVLAGWWCYGFRMFLFHSIHPSPRLQHDNFIGLLLIFRFEFCMQTNQSLEIQHVISVITVKTSLHLFKCFNHSTIFDKSESHKVCLVQELLGHKLVLTVGDGLTTIVFSAFEPRSNPSNSNCGSLKPYKLSKKFIHGSFLHFCWVLIGSSFCNFCEACLLRFGQGVACSCQAGLEQQFRCGWLICAMKLPKSTVSHLLIFQGKRLSPAT